MTPMTPIALHTNVKVSPQISARPSSLPPSFSDADLIQLFEHRPQHAWERFLEKYANLIVSSLRRLGFDHDASMDRFVFICEKLSEDEYRRLRGVRYLGHSGELTPWLVRVVKNLAINWAQSVDGRERLLKSIACLSSLDQKVFEAYFRKGLRPSEIREAIASQENVEVRLLDVLDSLERVLGKLTQNRLWRLHCQRAKRLPGISLTCEDADEPYERIVVSTAENPEDTLLRNERRRRVRRAVAKLPNRERDLIRRTYAQGMALKEAARELRISEKQARAVTKSARRKLRRGLDLN